MRYALGRIGPTAKAAAPVIAKVLVEDPAIEVRREAIVALEQWGADAKIALPAMTEALGDAHSSVRQRVALVIGKLGREGAAAQDRLMKAATDADPAVRAQVVHALAAVGGTAEPIISALIDRLGDESAEVRLAAIDELR